MSQRLPGAAALTDGDVMRRVQAGDGDAFGLLVDRFSSRAYGVAFGFAGDGARAEDIVQDAFLSIWRSRDTYRDQEGDAVGAWVMGTVRHRALDALRRDGRHDRRRADGHDLETRQPACGDLAEAIAERDQADRLRDTMARLPDAQREVITLAYYGELSTTEIASHLSLPLGTVKGRIRLGLDKLRYQLIVATADTA